MDEDNKTELAEMMNLGVNTMLDNEQMRKIMRMQLAAQMLTGAATHNTMEENIPVHVRRALDVTDELMRQALA